MRNRENSPKVTVTVATRAGRVVWTGQVARDDIEQVRTLWNRDMGTGRKHYRITVNAEDF